MRPVLIRRLLWLLPTLLGMSILAFALVAAAPGDPVRTEALRQGISLTPANEAALRDELGLSGTWQQRYVRWLSRAVQGDFGLSIATRRPVADEIASHTGPTLLLALAAGSVMVLTSLAVGLASALARSHVAQALWRFVTLAAVSTPGYWMALLALYFVAYRLGWARVVGDGALADLWLPALVLGVSVGAGTARVVRERALQVMSQDHVLLAIAAGLPVHQIVLRRIVPNLLPPLITLWAVAFGHLLGGAVIVEAVFGWPGLGRLVLQSIGDRDLPVLQAYLCLMGLMFVLVNVLAEWLGTAIDPRIAAR